MSNLLQMVIGGIASGCLYALLATAYSLLYRKQHALRLELMALPAMGGFVALTVIQALQDRPGMTLPMLLACAAIGAGIVAAAILLAFEIGIWPLFDGLAMPVRLLLAVLGAMAIACLAGVIWGSAPVEFPIHLGHEPVMLGEAFLYHSMLLVVPATLVMLLALHVYLKRTAEEDEPGAATGPAIAPCLWAAALSAAAGIGLGLHTSSLHTDIAYFSLIPLLALSIGGLAHPFRSAWSALALAIAWAVIGGHLHGDIADLFAEYIGNIVLSVVALVAIARWRRDRRPDSADSHDKLVDTVDGDDPGHPGDACQAGFTALDGQVGDSDTGSAYRNAIAVVLLLGIACWLAQARHYLAVPLTVGAALPLMFIALGYSHVVRCGKADLGFPAYPAIGAYIYASLAYPRPHVLSDEGLAPVAAYSPAACFALAGLMAAGLAYGVHRLVGKKPPILFAVSTFAAWQILLIVLHRADMANAPIGELGGWTGFSTRSAGTGFAWELAPLEVTGIGLGLLAGCIFLLAATTSTMHGTSPIPYAAGGAVGGIGGAWLATSAGFVPPGQFSSPMLVQAAALALVGRRHGLAGVLVLASLVPLLHFSLTEDVVSLIMILCVYGVVMVHTWDESEWRPERALEDVIRQRDIKAGP